MACGEKADKGEIDMTECLKEVSLLLGCASVMTPVAQIAHDFEMFSSIYVLRIYVNCSQSVWMAPCVSAL